MTMTLHLTHTAYSTRHSLYSECRVTPCEFSPLPCSFCMEVEVDRKELLRPVASRKLVFSLGYGDREEGVVRGALHR